MLNGLLIMEMDDDHSAEVVSPYYCVECGKVFQENEVWYIWESYIGTDAVCASCHSEYMHIHEGEDYNHGGKIYSEYKWKLTRRTIDVYVAERAV